MTLKIHLSVSSRDVLFSRLLIFGAEQEINFSIRHEERYVKMLCLNEFVGCDDKLI